MLMEYEEIMDIARSVLQKEGWDLNYNLKVELGDNVDSVIQASMNEESWEINLKIDKKLRERLGRISKIYKLSYDNPEKKAIYSAIMHEKGHWDVCPGDIKFSAEIFEGVSLGLARAGFTQEEIIEYTPQVANMFSDTIVNSYNSRYENFVDGVFLIFGTRVEPERGILFKRDIPEYMSIFVDVNAKLFGRDARERRIAERKLKGYKELEKYTKAILESLIGRDLAAKALDGSLSSEERKDAIYKMADHKGWEHYAARYAEIMSPFLKGQIQNIKKQFGNCGGACNVNSKKQRTAEGEGNKQGENKNQKRTNNKTKKGKETARKRGEGIKPGQDKKTGKVLGKIDKDNAEIRKEMAAHSIGIGGRGLYLTPFENLDAQYSALATKIVVNFSNSENKKINVNRSPLIYPIRRMDENEKLKDVVWSKTIFNPKDDDGVVLYRRDKPFTSDAQHVPYNGSYKDILFVFDVSGSMGWTGNALDGSGYDMVLRSMYAVLSYLESVGMAAYLNYGLIQFSGKTEFTGWKSYGEISEIKQAAFKKYQGDGTILDINVLEKAFAESKDKFVTIVVTDLGIWNLNEVLRSFKRMVKQGNEIVIINYTDSDMAKTDGEIDGILIKNVKNPSGLVGLILNISKDKYDIKPLQIESSNGDLDKSNLQDRRNFKNRI